MLITGSSGFLGSHTLKMFPNARTCDRPRDFKDLQGVIEPVIHFAGWSNVAESVREPDKYIENNALKLIPFFKKNEVYRFIFMSTGGSIYGSRHQAKEEDATFATCPHPYAQSKWLAEQIIKEYVPSYCIFRLANVFKEGESSVHKHFATDNPIVVFGNQVRDFVHVDVVMAAVKRAAESDITGIYNIGSGIETNPIELAEQFAKERGVSVRVEPKRVGDTVEYISLDCSKARAAGLM